MNNQFVIHTYRFDTIRFSCFSNKRIKSSMYAFINVLLDPICVIRHENEDNLKSKNITIKFIEIIICYFNSDSYYSFYFL